MKLDLIKKTQKEITGIISEFVNENNSDDYTNSLAVNYLRMSGRRYRPLLLLAVYKSLGAKKNVKKAVKKAVVAVECVHKASLIHDDIEDSDSFRNGYATLHTKFSVPVAINVGDYLAGMGFRLFVDNKIKIEQKILILKILCETQQHLCVGQGCDLNWTKKNLRISMGELLTVYKNKTSSMFALAFLVGAVLSGKYTSKVHDALKTSADALGVAYQIKDDLSDSEHDRNELSILKLTNRSHSEKLLYEHIDKSLSSLDELNVPFLKNCIKDMFKDKL